MQTLSFLSFQYFFSISQMLKDLYQEGIIGVIVSEDFLRNANLNLMRRIPNIKTHGSYGCGSKRKQVNVNPYVTRFKTYLDKWFRFIFQIRFKSCDANLSLRSPVFAWTTSITSMSFWYLGSLLIKKFKLALRRRHNLWNYNTCFFVSRSFLIQIFQHHNSGLTNWKEVLEGKDKVCMR